MVDRRPRAALAVALFLGICATCGCSSDEGSGARTPDPARSGPEPVFAEGGLGGVTEPSSRQAAPTGPAIEVVWEALAHEKHLLENSRFRRSGPLPPQKIVLLSASHPNAKAVVAGRGGEQGAQTAVIPDADMEGFLQGLEQRGFFRLARPAGYDAAVAGSSNARGRITVTRGGDSRSLISLRGQGLNEATKDVPRIYSEAKQAIMALRNMHPTLSVTRQGASGNASIR